MSSKKIQIITVLLVILFNLILDALIDTRNGHEILWVTNLTFSLISGGLCLFFSNLVLPSKLKI